MIKKAFILNVIKLQSSILLEYGKKNAKVKTELKDEQDSEMNRNLSLIDTARSSNCVLASQKYIKGSIQQYRTHAQNRLKLIKILYIYIYIHL